MSRNDYRNQARKLKAEGVASYAALQPSQATLVAEGLPPADSCSLLLSEGATARDAWISWLQPVFAGNASAYFTGTYSDDYGYSHGCMLTRNVIKDFARYLDSFGFNGRYVIGVERHAYRDILHLHGILQGPFSQEQLTWLKEWWQSQRGFAKVLPVLDGCTSYVTKYALKGDTEQFEWRL